MKKEKLVVAYVDENNVNSFEFVQMVEDFHEVAAKDALIFKPFSGELIVHVNTSTRDSSGNIKHTSSRNIYLDAELVELFLRGMAKED